MGAIHGPPQEIQSTKRSIIITSALDHRAHRLQSEQLLIQSNHARQSSTVAIDGRTSIRIRGGLLIMKAKLEAWIHGQWAGRGLVPCLLYPLSKIFQAVSAAKKTGADPVKLPVPVVVVGNIYVGGTGKTPVTIALAKEMRHRGWKPGVVSRGFGRKDEAPRLVSEESLASEVGDEPLLICREGRIPVAVSRYRAKAAEMLLEAHPEVNLIISDDGLQHYGLARDVELAVIGARGLGNGWCLPAGPLRESPARLDEVDAIVLNTPHKDVVKSRTPRFAASSCFGECVNLKTGEKCDIDTLASKARDQSVNVLAAAGIATPGRFFAMVRAHDIDCSVLELGDHFNFATNPFKDRSEGMILITGKDAVKCAKIPEIASDERIWVVGLEIKLDGYLIDLICTKINHYRVHKKK